MEIKVTRNYQITIPAEIRRELNINVGDVLEVTYDKEKKVIIIKKKEDWPCISIGREITPKEIKKMIEEVREELCL